MTSPSSPKPNMTNLSRLINMFLLNSMPHGVDIVKNSPQSFPPLLKNLKKRELFQVKQTLPLKPNQLKNSTLKDIQQLNLLSMAKLLNITEEELLKTSLPGSLKEPEKSLSHSNLLKLWKKLKLITKLFQSILVPKRTLNTKLSKWPLWEMIISFTILFLITPSLPMLPDKPSNFINISMKETILSQVI